MIRRSARIERERRNLSTMSIQAWIVALFISGIVLQLAYFTRGSRDRGADLVMLAAFLIGGALLSGPNNVPVHMGLLQAFFIFPFLMAMIHREELMPRVTEKVLLSCAITFWFMFFSSHYSGTPFDRWALWALAAPTAGTLLIAFLKPGLNSFWRIFFYAWFLLLVTLTGFHQFLYSYVSVFQYAADARKAGDLGLWTFPLAGMAFCQLAVYSAYLLAFIPMKSKHETLADARRRWLDYLGEVSARYDENAQFSGLGALGLLAGQGGLMLLNYRYRFIHPETLINIGVLLPVLIMALSPEPARVYRGPALKLAPEKPVSKPRSSFAEFAKKTGAIGRDVPPSALTK